MNLVGIITEGYLGGGDVPLGLATGGYLMADRAQIEVIVPGNRGGVFTHHRRLRHVRDDEELMLLVASYMGVVQ